MKILFNTTALKTQTIISQSIVEYDTTTKIEILKKDNTGFITLNAAGDLTPSHPDPKWQHSTAMGAQKNLPKNDRGEFFCFINF